MNKCLLNKFKNKEATIGVIGLGYVGLPLIIGFTEQRICTIGFDVDQAKVDQINKGISYIQHIPDEPLKKATDQGYIIATTDYSKIAEVDAIIICVPTPLDKYFQPDLSYVTGTMDKLSPYLRKGQTISLESTTYPGTTEEVLKPYIDDKGLVVGEDVYLVYSPEREDPGNPDFTSANIPKVIGGYTDSCLEYGMAVYSNIISNLVPVSNTKVAEFTKLLENIFSFNKVLSSLHKDLKSSQAMKPA